ncbi:FAD-dependent oxidoreductase [Nitrospirillum bahiense]|uniref:3-(3-hydroxy-phenyl)propionate hydroxylase n=1 Tax=Nitrospirillum amazonense TaxID=28077 RepID=A0A560GDW5_9PROT|nr:FAD-dependent oxidoreductase [Nitrospirillum amazonense]TWB32097.1 3-(3-hydroxy-phenyl)propionate hydroxylase [Nitrospirillum amazonense]
MDRNERRPPVVVVGAGPVGLAVAIDLALRGVATVVLDDNDRLPVGSRAICWAKRTLEIFNRLGVAGPMVDRGVTWKVGRLFHGPRQVYAFDLLPEDGHRMPAFINLPQHEVERLLVARCADFPDLIDLRWRHRVVAVTPADAGVAVRVEAPDGAYDLAADYLIACDGAKSPVRGLLGLDFAGQAFEERFLIADVEMKADFPAERWFWFEPPFHAGQSALLHKQPDDIYRIDLQLGPDADPAEEMRPERIIPRVRAMVGDRPFRLVWTSVYTFQCRRLARFRHGRVIFAGDSAHVVSPFGARGGNGGIQDADNLAWKLALVIQGRAPAALLDSYDDERGRGADENILNSARSTTFMTPKSAMERLFRQAVLDLAADHAFARRLVNSGRLSLPCSLAGQSLQTPAGPGAPGLLAPGVPCPDAPLDDGFLLDHLGRGFILLAVGDTVVPAETGLPLLRLPAGGLAAQRYGTGALYLIRPDQHVAARFPAGVAATAIRRAHRRALGEPAHD